MNIRKLIYLSVALLTATLLWGCGSSGGGGSSFMGQDAVPPGQLGNASCLVCHDGVHTTNVNNLTGGEISHLAGIIATNENSYYISHSCEDCHGGGSAHRGIGPIPYPRPDAARCAACHDEANAVLASNHNHGDATNISMEAWRSWPLDSCRECHTTEAMIKSNIVAEGVLPTPLHNISCAACHDSLKKEVRTFANSCANCHSTLPSSHLSFSPFGNEISERFVDSRKGDPGQRINHSESGCRACHSHQGAVVLLSLDEKINTRGELATPSYAALQAELYPDGWDTTVASMKRCSTCHDPHSGEVRGVGDLRVSDLNLTDPGVTLTGPANRVVYSAEFNLCTSCHMATNLVVTWNSSGGLGSGGVFEYQLGDLTEQVDQDYHYSDPARTILDTHFPGSYQGTTVTGYNINPASPNACTSCHDPHSNNKFEHASSQLYAEGIGMTHGNYTSNAFSFERADANCTPCHTGRDFPKMTFSNDLDQGLDRIGSPRFNALGCVSCHDMAVDSGGDVTLARSFTEAYEFEFNSGFVLASDSPHLTNNPPNATNPKNNQVCFECHKGRVGVPRNEDLSQADLSGITRVYDINYLHYSPSFAIMMGTDSGMIPLYEGKDYAEGFTLPLRHEVNYSGANYISCLACHNIHTPYGDNSNHANFEPLNLQTSLCGSCHYETVTTNNNYWRSFNVLRERTKVFGDALFETILEEVQSYGGSWAGETAATLKTRINASAAGSEMPSADLAQAAAIWKNFMYDDKAGWAHNSVLARQLMYDAIVEISDVDNLNAKICAQLATPSADTIGVALVSPRTDEAGGLTFNLDAGTTLRPITCP